MNQIHSLILLADIVSYQQRRLQKQLANAGNAGAAGKVQSGIRAEYTTEGGTAPLTVIVGTYATAGHLEAPPISWPASADPANIYLTYVVGLGDLPGIRPTGRVAINDKWHELTDMEQSEKGRGITVEGSLNDLCWFRFRDGYETKADGMLMDKLSNHAQRPWQSDNRGDDQLYHRWRGPRE